MLPHTLKIGAFQIDTPALFASYRICDFPRAGLLCHPWEVTGTQAVLANAFDLLGNKRTQIAATKIREKQGTLHEFIEFDGPLMLDSGAFNFQKQPKISIDPLDVLSIGIEFKTNISVVLDHPFLPKSGDAEKNKRWKNTVKNTRVMFAEFEKYKSVKGDVLDDFQLMPVLHGHDPKTLKRSLKEIIGICGPDLPIVGIGSLAPLARNGSKRTVINIICTVRKLLPDSHIHCFSMGSALLMLFAFYCGADTVDSQSWMLSAAFKNVQLPGFHWTRFSPRERKKDPKKYELTRRAFAEHLLLLINEEKFAVKDWDSGESWQINSEQEALSYLDSLEDQNGKNNIHHRACHNLYAFNFEAKRVREEKSNLETFISNRLSSTIYKNTFEYAINQVNCKS